MSSCAFAESLEVPLAFIASKVKTRREAAVLIHLGTLSHKLDELFQAAESSALRLAAVRDHGATIMSRASGGTPELASLLPLIVQAEAVERRNVARVEEQVRALEIELSGFCKDLEQFIEQHESTALEFAHAGVAAIAREKRAVAEVEKAVLDRLLFLVGAKEEEERLLSKPAEWPAMAAIAGSLIETKDT